jgi:hypothetical protein
VKFRKKPVVVEAEQWFPGKQVAGVGQFLFGSLPPGANAEDYGYIETLEGGHRVDPGDWIITGVKGEKYPCKPDIFEATYERVES